MNTNLSDKLKVLVVDDDELNQRMMRLLLLRDGHDVYVVPNGMDALEMVKYHDFDVILVDLHIPGMDGIEVSRRIREYENGKMRSYIAILTASDPVEQGRGWVEAGVDDYINKPFKMEYLQKILKYRIAEHQQRQTVRTDQIEPQPMNDTPMLDIELGLKQVGDDDDIYRDLLSGFAERLPERIKNMKNFLAEKDMASFVRAAHNIKGISASLGALQLSKYAALLEKQGDEAYTGLIVNLFEKVVEIAQKLELEVSNFLQGERHAIDT